MIFKKNTGKEKERFLRRIQGKKKNDFYEEYRERKGMIFKKNTGKEKERFLRRIQGKKKKDF